MLLAALTIGAAIGLAIVGLGLLGAAVVVARAGLRGRRVGEAPHCRTCDYDLTGAGSAVCPECGQDIAQISVVYGERRRRPRLIVCGAAACAVAVTMLAASGPSLYRQFLAPPAHRPVSTYIRAFRSYVGEMRALFAAGVAPDSVHKKRPGHAHVGGMLTILLIDRSRQRIENWITDGQVRAAALAELQRAEALVRDQFVPAYQIACNSTDPETAKALVPLMDQLDAHLAKILIALNGNQAALGALLCRMAAACACSFALERAWLHTTQP